VQQPTQAPRPAAKQTAASQDTVTISAAGRAANQAQATQQNAKPSGEVDHDGNNK
jgi:hypothetical protein